MTQQEFATWLGLAISTISRWERGQSEPVFTVRQFKMLVNRLEAIGYSMNDLPDSLYKHS